MAHDAIISISDNRFLYAPLGQVPIAIWMGRPREKTANNELLSQSQCPCQEIGIEIEVFDRLLNFSLFRGRNLSPLMYYPVYGSNGNICVIGKVLNSCFFYLIHC